MKSKKYKGISALFALLLMGSIFFSGIGAAVEIDKYPSYQVGDYFKYDFNAEGMIENMKDSYFGRDSNVSIDFQNSEMRFVRTENVNSGGEFYNCIVGTMVMEISFHVSGTMNGMTFSGDVHVLMKESIWTSRGDMKQVKTENMQLTYMNVTMMGQNMFSEMKTITNSTFNPPVAEYSLPVKVGKTWTTNTTQSAHTISMQRINGGSWKTQESNTTFNTSIKYSAISEETVNTKAGTFETIKIKETGDQADNSTYSYIYLTSEGLPVKMEIYSKGKLMSSAELTEYKYQGKGSSQSSGGIPGFEAISLMASLFIVLLLYRKIRK